MALTRRDFLKTGLTTAGLVLSWTELCALCTQAAGLEPQRPGAGKILVVVQMAGGNDGLNTVVPYGNGMYYQARPSLAVKQGDVLPMDGQIGWHPNMTAINDLYKAGKVAVLLGVGYPEPNRSHFRSIEIWQTAEPNRIVDTGWLGRYLDLAATGKQKADNKLFPAVNVDPVLPKSLSAERVIVPSVSDMNQFRFTTDAHYQQDRHNQLVAFQNIYADFSLNRPHVDLLRDVGLNTTKASDYLLQTVNNYKSDVKYLKNQFALGLRFIAQMITAGTAAQVYNITLNGFDTHANQLHIQANLLKNFSDSIAAFQRDLEAHSMDQDVLLFAFSEFGRRVAQNNGDGTDHGTAELVFVVGSAVKGGIYGTYPSLTNLDQGDLKYHIDFRGIYATLLDRWLNADSKQVLGARYDNIAFV